MHLNNPINNRRDDRSINYALGNFLNTLTHRLETEGLGDRAGLLLDVLRESAGEIPLSYTQEEVEAMALCSFILKLPPEERKDLERLERLFNERQMIGARRLLFGDLPPDGVSRQKASETVLTFLSKNPLGLSNLWHDSRLAAYYLLQGNPKITRDQILNGDSKVDVLPGGIGIITPKSACEKLIVGPLAGSTGIILILNFERGAKAVICRHFKKFEVVLADQKISDEDGKSWSRERLGMLDQGGEAVMGTLSCEDSCEDIISVLRALRSAGCDGPLTSVRIHIASPKIDNYGGIDAALRICMALRQSDLLRDVSDASLTQTLYGFSTSDIGSISVSISEGLPILRMRY
jgi:hypothetical protein